MEQVDRCRMEDIPAVAKLHMKVYGNPNDEPSEDLKSYYKEVLFDNPWCDEEIPSLVFRSKEGTVEGLLGVLTHRMVFNGKSIRASTPHSFMVAPDYRSSMTAIQIIRRFFEGPHDLVFGDGANDESKKLMEALGATTSYLYSMSWLCILRPFSYMGSALGKCRGLKFLATISRPACFFLDSLGRRLRRNPGKAKPLEHCTSVEMDSQSLLSCMTEFSNRSPLHPEYNADDIRWFWGFLKSNTRRGQSKGFEVRNEKGHRIGAYLYYLRAEKFMEVMLLWACEGSADIVFSHMLDHALKRGVTSVEGRMEPRFLRGISDNNCLIKRRRWVMVHARDPEVLNVLNRGDGMLSAMDGELWIHSLSDKLHVH